MTVLQSLEKPPEMIEQIRGYFDEARREFYEPEGLSDHLFLTVVKCGHSFPDEYKRIAYRRLRSYFDAGLRSRPA